MTFFDHLVGCEQLLENSLFIRCKSKIDSWVCIFSRKNEHTGML